MALAFHLLGPPQLLVDNIPVSVQRRSVVALLAYIVVNDRGETRQKHTRELLSALTLRCARQSRAASVNCPCVIVIAASASYGSTSCSVSPAAALIVASARRPASSQLCCADAS